MMILDFTRATNAAVQAVGLVAKNLPVCGPCGRNVVYADERQSVHVTGPLLVILIRGNPPRCAEISPFDLVHLHLAACAGDIEAAEKSIVDALTGLFPSRTSQGADLRAQVEQLFTVSGSHGTAC